MPLAALRVGGNPSAAEVLRLVLESMPCGMMTTDSQGQIVLVNSQTEKMSGRTRFTPQDQQTPARDFALASRDSAECRSDAEREAAFDPDDFDVPPHLRVFIDLPQSANVSISTEPGSPETSDWWEPRDLPPLGEMPEPRFAQPLHERAPRLMLLLHIDADQAWRIDVEVGALHYREAIQRCFTNRGYLSKWSVQ
jgi:hypothetical protein